MPDMIVSNARRGVHVPQNIRAGGTYISGTNGTSNGIVPMLRVYNQTARFVNQVRRRLHSLSQQRRHWNWPVQAMMLS